MKSCLPPIPNPRWRPLNLIATCGKCHTGANASFVKYDPHADAHDAAHYPAPALCGHVHEPAARQRPRIFRPAYRSLVPSFALAKQRRDRNRSSHHGKRSGTLLHQVHPRATLSALGAGGHVSGPGLHRLAPSLQRRLRHADARPHRRRIWRSPVLSQILRHRPHPHLSGSPRGYRLSHRSQTRIQSALGAQLHGAEPQGY